MSHFVHKTKTAPSVRTFLFGLSIFQMLSSFIGAAVSRFEGLQNFICTCLTSLMKQMLFLSRLKSFFSFSIDLISILANPSPLLHLSPSPPVGQTEHFFGGGLANLVFGHILNLIWQISYAIGQFILSYICNFF